jgi:hypothetical protein
MIGARTRRGTRCQLPSVVKCRLLSLILRSTITFRLMLLAIVMLECDCTMLCLDINFPTYVSLLAQLRTCNANGTD